MREKIGNVLLNYEYYSGKDLYSDGRIENEILDIVKNYSKEEFNRIIAERNQWPILYHLSHVRTNIIDWLPFNENDKVLEVGSGCGAITGALSEKADKVICIDLSKKRSLINAYRNKEKDNIEIIVGNFEDIEPHIEEKFDYITLIGVFEYAAGYITGESPYKKMLKTMSKHLKKDGKIIIAIENKFGLKYWAGCQEDHVGKYFESLEDYPNTEGVRTFSKGEIEEMVKQCDLCYKFYYPYPDYKLPSTIYSDEYLPQKGELDDNLRNFDRERMVLFDETKVYDNIIKEGIFPLYSNSFLLVLTKESS